MFFSRFFLGGFGLGGLKVKDVLCGGFVWMSFFRFDGGTKRGFGCGGEIVLLASPKFC